MVMLEKHVPFLKYSNGTVKRPTKLVGFLGSKPSGT
jgi:hypothetical protein